MDESLLTGESVPVEVGPGDEVTGATVNAGGRLVVRAERVGGDTELAQMARLVERAQTGKAAVQVYDPKGSKVADKQVIVGGDNILTMDLRGFNDGAYMFHVTFENGKRSSFRVVVTK